MFTTVTPPCIAGSRGPRYKWQRFWFMRIGQLVQSDAAFLRDPIDSLTGTDKHLLRPNDYWRCHFPDLDVGIAPGGAAVQAEIRAETGHTIEPTIGIGVRR